MTLIPSQPSQRPAWPALLLATCLLTATPALAGDETETTLWVGVSDARGRPVAGLDAGDFRVFEGTAVLPVRRVEPLAASGAPWRQVLYFDQLLSDRPTLRRAADVLATHAEALTGLGTVEIVAADPEPRLLLPATRDSALLAQVLARLALEAGGRDEIGRLRRELLIETSHPGRLIAEARRRESDLRRRQADRLMIWLADHGEGGSNSPRALWLTDGALALPNAAFFAAMTATVDSPGLGAETSAPPQAAVQEAPESSLARFLAASGWVALPLAIAGQEDEEPAGSEFDRWRDQAGAVERADAVDLLAILRRRRQQRERERSRESASTATTREQERDEAARIDAAALRRLALTPSADNLERFSRQSGGQALFTAEQVGALIGRLAGRFRLVLGPPVESFPNGATGDEAVTATAASEPSRPPNSQPTLSRPGATRAIELRLESDNDKRVVVYPSWIASGIPDELGAARVRRLLDLGLSGGQLDLLAQLSLPPATGSSQTLGASVVARLTTQLDLTTLPDEPPQGRQKTDLRLTLSAERSDGSTVLRRILVPEQDLSVGEVWEHSAALELPVDIERAALVIETLDGRLHGGDLASLSLAAPDFADRPAGDEEEVVPAPVSSAAAPTSAIRRSADGRFLDTVEVRLTELYISVTGKGGTPIRGLTREEFSLRQGGVEQPINSVLDAVDLPVTLGLAIDSSSSMFYKLPAVSRAAKALVRSLTPQRDRAFLVAFGPQTRLVQSTTAELSRIDRRLRDLEADGGTPLWSAIILSLEQLEQQKGKKALVVFLDGADDDGNARYRECLTAAQRSGVPIYLIVMNNEAARTEGRDFRTRSFTSRLDRLAATGAGRVYYVPIDADLKPVYSRIENELRSYYLLTFYARDTKADPTSGIDIKVARKGSSVRTLSGYRPGG